MKKGDVVKEKKYTVCVDFDGVLHSYTTPWINAHTIPDPPVAGAILWLITMLAKFEVVIFSTRCKTWRGRRAIRRWLYEHGGGAFFECVGARGLEDITLAKTKPAALIYLDDRAVRFTGPESWPTVDQIHKAKPWNK
jgi:hypothetical protein